jgi:RHS repeat-associated protein
MKIYHRLSMALCLFFVVNAANAQVVGLTEGHFRVDESGAATYSLPIAAPAGRAGVNPPVALSYSSNNMMEGPVGVGWAVSGMSSISRCPPTPIHDDAIQAVQYNDQDKLCLDGRRLILTEGTYLAPDSVYRFEVDDFSEITARGGSSTNGPQYFELHNKAGETHYYGNSSTISFMFYDHSDAFIEPGGMAAGVKAKTWMLKVVADIKRNFILYNYSKDTAKGSVYINNIEYSGNMDTYKSPFAKIQFTYKDYDKGFKGYYAGAHTYHDKLLERIDTSVDGDMYRSYFLRYEESDFIEERTLLTSIQECSDNSMSSCLKPTTFDWQRPELATGGSRQVCENEPGVENFCYDAPYSTNYNPFPSSKTIATSAPNRYTTQIFDINGDGFQDLVYVDGSYWYAKLATSYGLGSPQRLSSIGVSKKDYAMSMDYDGDGVRDLLVANSKTSNWHAISYQPSQVTSTWCHPGEPCEDFTYTSSVTVKNLGIIATGLEGGAQVMDVNGDGNEDIVFRSGRYLRTHLNDGDGTFTANKNLYTFSSTPSFGSLNEGYIDQTGDMKSASQIDMNGDGRSDLIMKVTTTTGGCYSNGRLVPGVSGPNECRSDIRGTWSTQTSTKNHIYLATGTLTSPRLTELTNFSGYVENIRVADFNGDGLSDIAYVSNNKWYYRLSNGKALLGAKEMGMTTASNRKDLTQFVDLNGDGRADVLHASSTSNWQVYFSRPASQGNWLSFQFRGDQPFDNNATIRFGDVNGDAKLDMLTSTGGSWKQYYSRKDIKEYVISKVTTGYGVPTTIAYLPMTRSTMYVRQASDENIDSDTVSPMSGAFLVAQVNTQSNTNSLVSVRYQYGGMLLHKKGRGSLGFQMLRTTDLQTDVVSETQYSQAYSDNDFAKRGMPIYSEQRKNGNLLSQSTNTILVKSPTAQGGVHPYISSSEESSYVYNSNGTTTLLSTTVSTNEIDTWGNPTEIIVKVTDEHNGHFTETKTTNAWGNVNEQRYGRLRQTTVVKNRTGDENNKTRISTFSYRSDMLLAGSVVSPYNAPARLTTTYNYDAYGNKTQTSVIGYSTSTGTIQTRTSKVVYGAHGRFLSYKENVLGETVTYKYNGQVASSASGVTNYVTQTGPNNIATVTYYDDFQQARRVDFADSKNAYTTRSFCSGCVTNSYFKISETLSGAPTKETYFDKWGRTVTSRVKGFDGSWWSTNITYDEQGKQSRVYEPNSTLYTETIYDDLNRPEEIRNPNGSKVYQYYNGRESRTRDELGQSSYTYSNGFGETASTRDSLYNTVTFTYDAFGNLTKTRTRAHNKNSDITNIYDVLGRKTQMTDPVKGTWNYTYNAFGELYTQKTARNHTITFAYDSLGRMIRRYEPSEGTSCWIYGTTANVSQKAVGKLLSKTKYAGKSVSCNSPPVPDIQKRYEYDDFGRVKKQTTQIGYTQYHQLQTYDSFSRPNVTTFPTGTVSVASKAHYNSYGYPYKTSRVSDGYSLSEVITMNSRGQVTEMKNGNNVTSTYGHDSQTGWLDVINVAKSSTLLHHLDISHDVRGNVTSKRSNYAASSGIGSDFTETYSYDALNRLRTRNIGYTAGSNSLPAAFKGEHSYTYDNWGNFKFKTGAGHYKYHATKVHQLVGVYSNYSNSVFTGSKYSFTYDANGNVEADGTRTFTYASFDKPTRITKGTATSDMSYGVDRELYYKDDTTIENGASVRYRRYYIGAYEKVVRTGGNGNMTEHKYNIGNAVLTYRSGSNTKSFVHHDNQGSVIATTDHLGQVATQDIYDPFGKQSEVYRAPVYITTLPPITDRGYTGHKQMNHVDIIHMNGRIYDPTIGRFMQADPFIQAPNNSQNYNRYSYVLNNPMSYTDPSGYFFKKLWQATTGNILRAIAKVPILNTAINVGLNFIPGCQVWCSAAFSAATTYAVTGSLKAAFTSGAITAATAYAFSEVGSHFNGLDGSGSINFGGNMLTSGQVAQQITAHALVGGVSSSLQGGKFGHGFFSAGVTKGIGGAFLPGGDNLSSGEIAQGTVVSAVIGGTASKISGGKFANGAQTGAFQYLFNQAGESLKRNLATPEQAKIIQQVRALAQDAADEWDNACAQAGGAPACAPSKRGSHIHKLFAIKLDNLGPNFAGEVSYLDGIVQRYGLKGTVRADGIYGPAASPQLVFELKTGYKSWLSVKEARNYATHLPKNEWGLVVIKVH